MKKKVQDLKVIRNKRINPEYSILVLEAPDKLGPILPGQFVEILLDNLASTFLRRPISVFDVDYESNTISLLIKNVGAGTNAMVCTEEGDYLNTLYPLGNAFSLDAPKNVLLVGGGVGVAPLLLLAKELNAKGIVPDILLGGRSNEHIVEVEEYEKYGKVYITTEDGSEGEKGYVVNHSIMDTENPTFKKIFTCGPDPMMKAVAKYGKDRGIDCDASLENTMACGIGACLCCVEDTVKGNVCVCTEGPVFNTKDLKW